MDDHKEKQQEIDELQGKVAYLQSLTEKIIDSTRTIDNHANVMVGLNTAIFALVMSMLFEADHLKLTMGIVALFSLLSAIAAVFAIRLPRLFSRKNYPMSLFHTRRIAQFDSADQYAQELRNVIQSDGSLFAEYAREAYNLSKYYYTPKRRMLTWSRYFFLFGVITSALFLLLEKIGWFTV
jgi:hypothetical protein